MRARRPGFSLIEALVVLAISGMALAIVFSIGLKAGDAGFGLGRKAMSAADLDVAVSDYRAVVRSIALRPERAFLAGVDTPVVGAARRFEGEVVMERATQCAPAGWAGTLVLTVEPRGDEQILTCTAGERTATLFATRRRDAALSYSVNGRDWSDSYTNAPPGGFGEGLLRSARVFVRFSGGAGMDVIEAASSGLPDNWARPVDDF